MKKRLGKKKSREQKTLQLYGCDCYCSSCSGCASVPSSDYSYVKDKIGFTNSASVF